MDKNSANGIKRDYKKYLLGFVFIAVALTLFVSTLTAYFSDLEASGNKSAASSTLDITGDYQKYLNGSDTPTDAVVNFAPGDVIVVKATITNAGFESAWVRDFIEFTDYADADLYNALKIYKGEKTRAELAAADSDLLEGGVDGIFALPTAILDGTGEGANPETDLTIDDTTYEAIGGNTYSAAFTIYFDHNAGNAAQDKTVAFTVKTQALQFRNNNTAAPDGTAWSTVTALTV
jgi:hypothetical protein